MDEEVIKWIKIAIKLEEKGLKFYTKCLEAAVSGEVREIFDFLVKAETLHKKTLEDVLKEVANGNYDEVKRRVDKFTKVKVKIPVFRKKDLPGMMSPNTSLMTKFNKAMDFEREGMAFYMGVLMKEKNPELKILLNRLASDELLHKQEIEKLGFGMFAITSYDLP